MKAIERKAYGYGKGSLVKFDDGPNWYSCYSVNGQEHRESTGTPDEKVAKRFHKKKLDEIAVDRQGLRKFIAPVQQRVTVADLLADFETDLQIRRLKSARKVLYHAVPIREHFGAMRALDVTAAVVDTYITARRAAGKSNATINRGVQVLDAAGKLGVRNGKLTVWPKLRKLSEAGNAKQGFFEASEFETVLRHLPEHLQDAARFAYACGWRKSEVVGLRWEWVDAAAGQIVLPDSKNGRGRVLAIAGDLVELLKRREQARLVETPDERIKVVDLVFHRKGQPLGDFKRAWHAALVAAGFSEQVKQPDGSTRTVYTKTFHDFRRTAARNLVRAGVREGVAMSVTGHRTRSVFDRYNITSTDDVRAALEAVSLPTSGEAR